MPIDSTPDVEGMRGFDRGHACPGVSAAQSWFDEFASVSDTRLTEGRFAWRDSPWWVLWMHLYCQPSKVVGVALPIDFVTTQDLLVDEAACREIWDLVSSQFHTRGKFLAVWPCVRHVVLHRDDQGIVDGFLFVSEPVTWQLDYVVVRHESRGRGIASALVRFALDEACRRSVPCVTLSCAEALVPFYRSCGFQPVSTPAE